MPTEPVWLAIVQTLGLVVIAALQVLARKQADKVEHKVDAKLDVSEKKIDQVHGLTNDRMTKMEELVKTSLQEINRLEQIIVAKEAVASTVQTMSAARNIKKDEETK